MACIRSANRDRANSVAPQIGRQSPTTGERTSSARCVASTPTEVPNVEAGQTTVGAEPVAAELRPVEQLESGGQVVLGSGRRSCEQHGDVSRVRGLFLRGHCQYPVPTVRSAFGTLTPSSLARAITASRHPVRSVPISCSRAGLLSRR